jgi:hypothetical protein
MGLQKNAITTMLSELYISELYFVRNVIFPRNECTCQVTHQRWNNILQLQAALSVVLRGVADVKYIEFTCTNVCGNGKQSYGKIFSKCTSLQHQCV